MRHHVAGDCLKIEPRASGTARVGSEAHFRQVPDRGAGQIQDGRQLYFLDPLLWKQEECFEYAELATCRLGGR